MVDFGQIIPIALLHGCILTAGLSVLIVGSLRVNAEVWLNDYPPDIRKKFGPMSAEARRQRIIFGVLFLVIAIGSVTACLVHLNRVMGDPTLAEMFVCVFLVLTIFNLCDLVLLDWLLFVRIQPRYIVLPGTEGMDGYRDYWFHFHCFLIGILISGLVAGVATGIMLLVDWLTT